MANPEKIKEYGDVIIANFYQRGIDPEDYQPAFYAAAAALVDHIEKEKTKE